MDITAMLRSDRCTVVFPKSSKFPGNSSKRSRTRKKFAGWDPSWAKSPGKHRFSVFKTGQICTHLGSKRWQMGAKNASWVEVNSTSTTSEMLTQTHNPTKISLARFCRMG
jgi:hypothetical protein